ncbi:MAG: hypothetical protein QOJ84_1668 [Bradyrhizobium sp.]|jgi:hypothetical protein|nr:hypothetical protein [Bradyrhizobium sp.]
MQRAFDRLDQQENRARWKWTAGFAAACGVILFVALTSNSPTASNWVSQAAQAEVAASTMTPDAAPVQIAAGKAH